MSCEHDSFQITGRVTRISDQPGGPITDYWCDLSVRCETCGADFVWLGLPAGHDPRKPTVDVTARELRVPIVPRFSLKGRQAAFLSPDDQAMG